MRILITGATGMVGSGLARRLMSDGHEVTALIRSGASRIRLQDVEQSIRVVSGDIRDAEAVRAAVQGCDPDAVFHLASTPLNPPTTDHRTHLDTIVGGTFNLLEALKDRPHVRCVVTGTLSCYGSGAGLREDAPLQPGTMLGAAKASASLFLQAYARLYRMQLVELRLCMPYGCWEHPQRLLPHVILSALEGRDIRMTEGRQQRDVVYLDDVLEALWLAATRPVAPGAVFNIGSGVGVPVRSLVEQVLRLMGNPVRPLFGAIPTRPDEIMEMSADIGAARAGLGWSPRTSLDDGLRRYITWVEQHRDGLRALAEGRR